MDRADFDAGKGMDAKTLLRKYADGTATEQERQLFEQWYDHLNREDRVTLTAAELEAAERAVMATLQHRIPAPASTIRRLPRNVWRISVAAAVILLAGIGFLIYHSGSSVDPARQTTVTADIAPGKNTATLQLPDGRVIQLSDAKTGVVIDASALSYNDGSAIDSTLRSGTGAAHHTIMLTASTPRGGTYQFTLDDGTKVWLNADSKLEFASAFTGPERRVKLSGEAFFDVARDGTHPFIVESRGQEVKVLGTQFNLNTYADEPGTTTTLLEGSVLVQLSNTHKTVMLQPGEQSVATTSDLTTQNATTAEIEQVVAWKNGDFIFDDNIQTIMKQIARWYDVEISYKGPIPTEEFGGKVSRSKTIKQVLKVLESTNSVHFDIKERRVTVMK